MAFEIPLAEQKVKPHQVTALHLVAGFAFFAFSALGLLINNTVMTLPDSAPIEQQQATIHIFDATDTALSLTMGISIIILFAALFRNKWLRQPKVNKLFRVGEMLTAGTIAIYMLTIQYNVPAGLFGVLAITIIFSLFWETGKNTNITVTFNENGIKLPVTSRRRNISWDETEKVLLRHGTVTINCVDNRMYQWVAAQHSINSAIFEAYCDAHIEAEKHKRGKDW